ncbi:MAG: hypothetical protein GX442_25670 [Candidatus Riflebacteria bacterium]|nr:hypothetical protein [Candidatus Riflebacteria bacterium]
MTFPPSPVPGGLQSGSPPDRRGFVTYMVFALFLGAVIFATAIWSMKRGAVELFSRSLDQHRLTMLAQSATTEMAAILRAEANRVGAGEPADHLGPLLRSLGTPQVTDKPPASPFVRRRVFQAADLPLTNALAERLAGGGVRLSGVATVVLTSRARLPLPSYLGHIDLVGTVVRTDTRATLAELRERRDLKVANLRDFFDKYVLFVKNYGFDYNCPDPKLVLEGLDGGSTGVVSRAYFGNRFYPACPEFDPRPASAPVLFDLDIQADEALVPLLLGKLTGAAPGGTGIQPAGFPAREERVRQASANQLFHVLPAPVKFSDLYKSCGFAFEDFYQVSQIRELYEKVILEPARKQGSVNPDTVSDAVLKDFAACGGDYGKSKIFRALVETCVNHWAYHFGYTDARHLWSRAGMGPPTPFVSQPPLTGLQDFAREYNAYNRERTFRGAMPIVFGPGRDRPVQVEGPVFLRFFKLAFFDGFSASFPLLGGNVDVDFPAVPLPFQAPDKPASFLTRPLSPPVGGLEPCLMSRDCTGFPVNRLFFQDAVPFPPTSTGVKPADLFPALDRQAFSRFFRSGEDLCRGMVVEESGERVLLVDGIMYVERGDIDLSTIRRYRGQGMIYLGFRGNCHLGSLRRTGPGDTLRIFVQDGGFVVRSPEEQVRIEASLIATTCLPGGGKRDPRAIDNQGKLIPNGKGVEIVGNLVVDYLFLKHPTFGVPPGKVLKIIHDPLLFEPLDPCRVSLGTVRTLWALQTAQPRDGEP